MIGKDLNNKSFYAKLMLFGEYSIIHQSKALAIPLKKYSGQFKYLKSNENRAAVISNRNLKNYAGFLSQNFGAHLSEFKIETDRFLNDIESGLFFDSNIPQGYGVGSSGALIAAIYDKYVYNEGDLNIRERLAAMESFFHGKSSGIDPLVAFFNQPLLFESNSFVEVKHPDFEHNGVSGVYLIDTGQVSETAPLVKSYLAKVDQGVLNHREYSTLVNKVIDSIYKSNDPNFQKLLKELSLWQYANLSEMIPESMKKHWETGLNRNGWIMKLCGSGGGGFLMVFALNNSELLNYVESNNLTIYRI